MAFNATACIWDTSDLSSSPLIFTLMMGPVASRMVNDISPPSVPLPTTMEQWKISGNHDTPIYRPLLSLRVINTQQF
jgi:hypothetical protein